MQNETLWAHLDTGAGRDFISKDAAKTLQLKPIRYEVRHLMTVKGTKKQLLPIYQITINSLDGISSERIEVIGVDLQDFSTIERPSIKELKEKFKNTRDKRFYTRASNKYTIHLISGDNTYCKIRIEEVCKGKKGEPIVEGTTFGYVIHGGDRTSGTCMYVKDNKNFERLYSLDILGVEDKGEDHLLDIHREFNENINNSKDGRYEVKIPWVPGSRITENDGAQSRSRLKSVERRMYRNPELKRAYQDIVNAQLKEGIIEKVPEVESDGERIFYLCHTPIVREEAVTTKVRMVFDASARPSPMKNSLNECIVIVVF